MLQERYRRPLKPIRAARARTWNVATFVALLAIAFALCATPLLGALEAWTLKGTRTPALLARAVLVRHRNAERMRAYATSLHAGAPLAGVRVLLTGATSGLGLGIAGQLALGGASLVLPYRRPIGLPELRESIAASANDALRLRTRHPGSQPRPPLLADEVDDVLGLPGFDLASFSSIERTADQLARAGVRVSALVDNAGVVSLSGSSEQGFESTFAVNFLGTLYFTLLLKQSGVLPRGPRRNDWV
mmetsp:Transcript_21336/g.49801  ORF Transcript_21336/g.49801 Transcript_21336/m.49801 type:complete len:246 (+) Transcript_21336:159-896(+)